MNRTRSAILFPVLLATELLSLAASAQVQNGKDDPQILAAQERYQSPDWPKGFVRAGLALGSLEIPGFAGEAFQPSAPNPLSRGYSQKDSQVPILVEMTVGDSIAEAHRALLENLSFVSSPRPVPRAQSKGINVGEIGFVGFAQGGSERISWIAFVRGNVSIRVLCLDPRKDPHPDMPSIALHIDTAIQREPALPEGTSVPHPLIRRFAAPLSRCTAGETIPIDLDVSDALGGRVLLYWVVGGPGQGYMEEANGKWALHTTGPGTLTLTLNAIGSTGTFSSASLKIEVADD